MDPAWQFSPLLIPKALAALAMLPAMALVSRHSHRSPSADWILAVLSIAGLWALASTLEYATGNLVMKQWFASFGYVGAIGGAFALFHFVWTYINAGQRPPIRVSLGLLAGGVGCLALVFTHPIHDLIWSRVTPVTYGGARFALYERGPLFWLSVTYSYGLMAASSLLLIRHTFGLDPLYRRQSLVILLATLAPWLFSLAYMLRLGPMPALDLTPVGFAVTGALISWGSLRLQFLEIVPVAERNLFRNLPDPVFLVDSANRLIQANRAAVDRFPSLAREPGLSVPSALKDYPALAENLMLDEENDRQSTVRTADAWWDVRSRRIGRDATGSAGRLISLRDITRLKKAEEQLARTTGDLERTLKRIEHLRVDAEKANRDKSLFLAQVSHDIRGPLHAILGTAEMLLEQTHTENEAEALETVRDASLILQRLTNDLLDLSRLESGPLDLHREPFQWEQVIAPLRKILALSIREKGLSFKLETVPDPLPDLFGDAQMVRQILFNLVGNAIKFTDHGKVSLTARIMDESYLRIQVSDTGHGIPAERLSGIFEPFNRGDRDLSHTREGTGLGLAITRRLVDAMHGRIRVHSVPDRGTVFSLELPLVHGSPARRHREGSAAEEKQDRPAVVQAGPRVLLADDDPLSRRVSEALLTHCGCQVVSVEGGLAALETLGRERFDAVVLDGQMQDLNGWETAWRIRRMTGGDQAAIPIIAVTAGHSADRLSRWQAAGVHHILIKPVQRTEIQKALNDTLS
ncbi:MAG: histidine kinase N-terminal 7TM domain-containing protein [Opitutales bacterium]